MSDNQYPWYLQRAQEQWRQMQGQGNDQAQYSQAEWYQMQGQGASQDQRSREEWLQMQRQGTSQDQYDQRQMQIQGSSQPYARHEEPQQYHTSSYPQETRPNTLTKEQAQIEMLTKKLEQVQQLLGQRQPVNEDPPVTQAQMYAQPKPVQSSAYGIDMDQVMSLVSSLKQKEASPVTGTSVYGSSPVTGAAAYGSSSMQSTRASEVVPSVKYSCEACGVSVNSQMELQQHYRTKEHNSVVKGWRLQDDMSKRTNEVSESVYCDCCDLHFPSEGTFFVHTQGVLHATKLAQGKGSQASKGQNQEEPTTTSSGQNSATKDKPRWCKLCDITHEDDMESRQHFRNAYHRKHYLSKQLLLGFDEFFAIFGGVPYLESEDEIPLEFERRVPDQFLNLADQLQQRNTPGYKERLLQYVIRSGKLNNGVCKVCRSKTSGPDWWFHILGKKHAAKVQEEIKRFGLGQYLQHFGDIAVVDEKSANMIKAERPSVLPPRKQPTTPNVQPNEPVQVQYGQKTIAKPPGNRLQEEPQSAHITQYLSQWTDLPGVGNKLRSVSPQRDPSPIPNREQTITATSMPSIQDVSHIYRQSGPEHQLPISKPDEDTFSCKLCDVSGKGSSEEHYSSHDHSQTYLAKQTMYGLVDFFELYGDIPFGVMYIPNLMLYQAKPELVLPVKTLNWYKFIGADVALFPKDIWMRAVDYVCRSGVLTNFMCNVCGYRVPSLKNWIVHINSVEPHMQRCLQKCEELGWKKYILQYGHIALLDRSVIMKQRREAGQAYATVQKILAPAAKPIESATPSVTGLESYPLHRSTTTSSAAYAPVQSATPHVTGLVSYPLSRSTTTSTTAYPEERKVLDQSRVQVSSDHDRRIVVKTNSVSMYQERSSSEKKENVHEKDQSGMEKKRLEPRPETKECFCRICELKLKADCALENHLKTMSHSRAYMKKQLDLGLNAFASKYKDEPFLLEIQNEKIMPRGKFVVAPEVLKLWEKMKLPDTWKERATAYVSRCAHLCGLVCGPCNREMDDITSWWEHVLGKIHISKCVSLCKELGWMPYCSKYGAVPLLDRAAIQAMKKMEQPPAKQLPARKSPSPKRAPSPRRSSSPKRRSPSPRRRSPSPKRQSQKRSPSPRRKRSSSPRRKRSPSPRRKRSSSPRRKRSKSPRRKRSPSPKRKRSQSPKRKRSSSPRRKKSKSPRRKRSSSPSRRRSPSSIQSKSQRSKRSPSRSDSTSSSSKSETTRSVSKSEASKGSSRYGSSYTVARSEASKISSKPESTKAMPGSQFSKGPSKQESSKKPAPVAFKIGSVKKVGAMIPTLLRRESKKPEIKPEAKPVAAKPKPPSASVPSTVPIKSIATVSQPVQSPAYQAPPSSKAVPSLPVSQSYTVPPPVMTPQTQYMQGQTPLVPHMQVPVSHSQHIQVPPPATVSRPVQSQAYQAPPSSQAVSQSYTLPPPAMAPQTHYTQVTTPPVPHMQVAAPLVQYPQGAAAQLQYAQGTSPQMQRMQVPPSAMIGQLPHVMLATQVHQTNLAAFQRPPAPFLQRPAPPVSFGAVPVGYPAPVSQPSVPNPSFNIGSRYGLPPARPSSQPAPQGLLAGVNAAPMQFVPGGLSQRPVQTPAVPHSMPHQPTAPRVGIPPSTVTTRGGSPAVSTGVKQGLSSSSFGWSQSKPTGPTSQQQPSKMISVPQPDGSVKIEKVEDAVAMVNVLLKDLQGSKPELLEDAGIFLGAPLDGAELGMARPKSGARTWRSRSRSRSRGPIRRRSRSKSPVMFRRGRFRSRSRNRSSSLSRHKRWSRSRSLSRSRSPSRRRGRSRSPKRSRSHSRSRSLRGRSRSPGRRSRSPGQRSRSRSRSRGRSPYRRRSRSRSRSLGRTSLWWNRSKSPPRGRSRSHSRGRKRQRTSDNRNKNDSNKGRKDEKVKKPSSDNKKPSSGEVKSSTKSSSAKPDNSAKGDHQQGDKSSSSRKHSASSKKEESVGKLHRAILGEDHMKRFVRRITGLDNGAELDQAVEVMHAMDTNVVALLRSVDPVSVKDLLHGEQEKPNPLRDQLCNVIGDEPIQALLRAWSSS